MPGSSKSDCAKSKQIEVDLKVSRTQQPANAYLLNLSTDIFQNVLSPYLSNNDVSSLTMSCKQLYTIHQPDLKKRAMQKLLQAVEDNNRETVKIILDLKPELLLAEPGNLEIQSKKTGPRFYAEKPLPMAGKKRKLAMVELLLSYVDKLAETDKAVVLAQWKAPNVNDPKEKRRLNQKYRKLQEEYRMFLQPLIAVIVKESYPNGYDGELSEETEKKLSAFRKTMLPDAAVRLDDYYDIEQLLIAAYDIYISNFNVFQDWNQRCVFCTRVIDFIHSLVQLELSQIPYAQAAAYKTVGGIEMILVAKLAKDAWQNYVEQKTQSLASLYGNCVTQNNINATPVTSPPSPWCLTS